MPAAWLGPLNALGGRSWWRSVGHPRKGCGASLRSYTNAAHWALTHFPWRFAQRVWTLPEGNNANTAGFALLLLASYLIGRQLPHPVTVARARCVEDGWPAEDLLFSHFKEESDGLSSRATVKFLVQGQNLKVLRVELRQRTYFLPWSVAEVREEDGRKQ